MPDNSIYNKEFLHQLFDEMSATYEAVNTIASFGFTKRWRKQCVDLVQPREGEHVYDLMSGMGECFSYIMRSANKKTTLHAIDFSEVMCRQANKKTALYPASKIHVHCTDLFQNPCTTGDADCIVSAFGMKTFNNQQLEQLADETYRLLRNGGRFAFIEASLPPNALLRRLYLFYISRIVPIIGRVFLGNIENYRMLGIYTRQFGDARHVQQIFNARGLQTSFKSYFFGCMTAIYGTKKQ